MNGILKFFKGIGHRLGQGLGFIASHVTEAQLTAAIGYVEAAEDKFTENTLKRTFVVNELQKLPGVNENVARLITEMAVGLVKKKLHKITEDAVEAVTP